MASLRQIDVTTSYVALPDIQCNHVSILNSSGAALDIRLAAATGADQLNTLPDGMSIGIPVAANAKEIEIKGAGAVSDGVQITIQ